MHMLKKRGRPLEKRRNSLCPDRELVGSYIDTIRLIKHSRMSDELWDRLLDSFGPGRGIYKVDVVPDHVNVPSRNYVINYVKLHRPTPATVKLLDEIKNDGHSIGAVDVALDILVRTLDQAVAWQNFLENRLISSRSGSIEVTYEDDTAYYNKYGEEGMRYALYSDQVCRLDENFMACHLEARIVGKRALERARLFTSQDILRMSYRNFWDARLDFRRAPSFERLARVLNGSASSRTDSSLGDEQNRFAAQALLDASKNPRGVVVAQTLAKKMRDFGGVLSKRPLSRFHRERHDWLLPSTKSVYWHPGAWK